MSENNLWKLAGAVILPNAGGIVNGWITRKNIKNWYVGLNFPPYRPPNWIFAPMWTTLYSAMGYASYLVWREGGFALTEKNRLPLAVYGAQLALNWSWTPLFFGMRNIKAALIDIAALTSTATVCGVLFYRVNKTAGVLFVPYIAWLGFASLLNNAMYQLNSNEPGESNVSTEKNK